MPWLRNTALAGKRGGINGARLLIGHPGSKAMDGVLPVGGLRTN